MSRALAVIPISIQRMICDGCGAETNAACNCGVAYQPKAVRAREAVEAHPEKSDRAIAKEIGASPTTVGKAREELSSGGQLDEAPRTGLDGKTRKMPEKKSPEQAPDPDPDVVEMEAPKERRERLKKPLPDIEDDEQYTLNDYFDLNKENSELRVRVDKLSAALEAKEVQAGRNWPGGMTKKQKEKRDKHLGGVAYYQRQLEYLYAEVTNAPNWRVIITEDGKREGNGLRFALREEAERYLGRVLEEAREEFKRHITGVVIPIADDRANVTTLGNQIFFSHGDCVLFTWHPLDASNEEAEEAQP